MTDDGLRPAEPGVTTKWSPRSVSETVDRLTSTIMARGLTLFAMIDHSGAAESVGLPLRGTKLIIFGSPASGTPVMVVSPLAALDLPLKVLVWDDDGQTRVSYTSPQTLAVRYRLGADLAANLHGIDAITDAVVAP